MLKIRAFFTFLFALALANAANFTSTHGKLSVSGGKILNKSNQEIVLRGMSLYWYNGPWGGVQPGNDFYTSNVVSGLANNWGANVVRAAIGNVQQNPSNALSMAKSMMDWANSAGIYVIIDNHSHTAHRSAHATAANNFFRDVSAYVKQKSYTHVLYEIYNEPLCDNDQTNNINCNANQRTTWAQIKTFAQPVITTIRGNDPDGLIIIGTPYYSSNISAARNDPISGKNLLYALHFYAGESGHGNYREALKAAYCANFPVFVSEWGTSPASGNGTISTSNSNTWISLLEAAKVSHANWSLSNTNETSAALTGTSITGGLTNSGTYVKNLMRLNSGATLSAVGLTAQTIDCGSSVPTGPNGRIGFGTNGSLANFLSKSGADSVFAKYNALVNKSATFTASYTFTGIERPGTYLIQFYTGSTANGTVSWSGRGISSGQAQITSSGALDTYKYTEPQLITVTESPETPLNLSFNMPSANTLHAVYVYTYTADSLDSIKFNISSPVQRLATGGKHWTFDAATSVFIFEKTGGSLAIYNLRGERKAIFPASGRVSVKSLPAGAYLAVYRHGSEFNRKTIFLK
ncbi:MAG: glycoside hydrolase family 5 protein [Candidatus Fibromonas sp.]|jgi:endoglucanase|nr:glycoside hydrolase family 5 protein [Candidatus Fibromonas sp.]